MTGPVASAEHARRANGASQLARGGLIAVAGSAINGVAAFVVAVMIARGTESTAASGAVFVATAVFNVGYIVSTLGAEVGLVRNVSRSPSAARKLLRTAGVPAAIVSVSVALAVWTSRHRLGQWLADGSNPADVSATLGAVAPFIPFATLAAVALAASRGLATMTPTTMLDRITRPVVQVLAVTVAGVLGASVSGIAAMWALAFVPSFIGASWWITTKAPRPTGVDAVTVDDMVVSYWEFTAPQAVTAVLNVILRWADILIVAALAGTNVAAVYTAASRLLLAGTFVNGAIMQAVSPLVSAALGRNDRDEARRLLSTGTAWLVAVVWPGYVALILLGGGFLEVFGPDYRVGATALAILSLAMLVATGVGPIEAVLLMDGGSRLSLADNFAAVVVMLTIDVILVPQYGLSGAAVGWAAGLLVTNLGPLWQVKRRLNITPFSRAHLLAATTAVASMGTVAGATRLAVDDPGLGIALAATVAGMVLHVAVLSRFADELQLGELRSSLRSKR